MVQVRRRFVRHRNSNSRVNVFPEQFKGFASGWFGERLSAPRGCTNGVRFIDEELLFH
jgi:hypothetical protein